MNWAVAHGIMRAGEQSGKVVLQSGTEDSTDIAFGSIKVEVRAGTTYRIWAWCAASVCWCTWRGRCGVWRGRHTCMDRSRLGRGTLTPPLFY